MTSLDRYADPGLVYVVTAIEAATGIRRDLWFGQSLRLAVRHQNVIQPKKLGGIYRDYEVEERALAKPREESSDGMSPAERYSRYYD